MKYILDVDTGIDDALAIVYSLANKLDIIGITTVFGNNIVSNVTNNTLNLLELFNSDIPVYEGSSHATDSKEFIPNEFVYTLFGKNGLGDIKLSHKSNKQEKSAIDFIIDSAKKYKNDLTIICSAPLTNLANAYLKDKAIKDINVVSMSGAYKHPGNITNDAEANIYKDIKAAKIVYDNFNVTSLPLDVTTKVSFSLKDIEKLNTLNNRQAKVLYSLFTRLLKYETTPHDVLTIEAIIHKEAFKHICTSISINNDGKMIEKHGNNTNVCLDIDNNFKERFVNNIYKYLITYEKQL